MFKLSYIMAINTIVASQNHTTEGLRKRSMIRPQHVDNRRVKIKVLLVFACHNNVFDTVIGLTKKCETN